LRQTTLSFDPAPDQLSRTAATYTFELQSNEFRSIGVTVQCREPAVEDSKPLPFRSGLRAAFYEQRAANRGITTVTSSNQVFNEMICRSMADIAMLTTDTPQGPYPYAGIP